MAAIRHLALRANDPEALAAFYMKAFGMTEVHRHKSVTGPGAAVYLSDGYLNLAIIPARDAPEGLFHFGIAVDDIAQAHGAALEAGAVAQTEVLPVDGRFTETYVTDPAGIRIDLATGWKI
jgi:catechol 2,3-dioxygenase-like lactoylglutathione lyase family enzyme